MDLSSIHPIEHERKRGENKMKMKEEKKRATSAF